MLMPTSLDLEITKFLKKHTSIPLLQLPRWSVQGAGSLGKGVSEWAHIFYKNNNSVVSGRSSQAMSFPRQICQRSAAENVLNPSDNVHKSLSCTVGVAKKGNAMWCMPTSCDFSTFAPTSPQVSWLQKPFHFVYFALLTFLVKLLVFYLISCF